tara:strand:- start:7414 stop:8535 length:1122 start_codon:yes stop_codon:yes gene_type:complete
MKYLIFGPTSSTGISEDTYTLLLTLLSLNNEVLIFSTTKDENKLFKCTLENHKLNFIFISNEYFLDFLSAKYIVASVGAIPYAYAYCENYKNIFQNAIKKIAYVAVEAELEHSLNKYLLNFDLILCNSCFMKNIIDKCTNNKVNTKVIYPHVNLNFKESFSEKLKNQILKQKYILAMADYKSRPKRKGFDIILKVFQRLSSEFKDLNFILKTYEMPFEEEKRLRAKIRTKNFILINKKFNRNQILTLISNSNVYFSPHRTEGFGRIIAEAMGLGTLVCASNYSGNLDYMNKSNSILINGKLIKIKSYEYTSISNDALWFEPELKDCLDKLRICIKMSYENRQTLINNAKNNIKYKYNLQAAKTKIKSLLKYES